MNKDNAHLFLPLVKALAEGRTIQFRQHSSRTWETKTTPTFSYPPDHYRIKPEPVERWALERHGSFYSTYDTEEHATHARELVGGSRIFKMREVIE